MKDPGDPKSPDPTGSGSGSATLTTEASDTTIPGMLHQHYRGRLHLHPLQHHKQQLHQPALEISRWRLVLPASRPSIPGVVDVWQVFDLLTNLPTNKVGIELAAMQAAQMTDEEGAQLSKLKGFSFSYVMFKEISLPCDVSTEVNSPPRTGSSWRPLHLRFVFVRVDSSGKPPLSYCTLDRSWFWSTTPLLSNFRSEPDKK